MKLSMKLTLLALVVIAAGFFAQAAQAGEVKVSGKGWIWARGVGTIHAVGNGHAVFRCFGEGVIKIRNYKDVEIDIHGEYEKKVVGDTLFIRHLKGRVSIKGKKVNVRFAKGRVHFFAKGKGTVYLKGRGKYHTGHGKKDWPEGGGKIEMESSSTKSHSDNPHIEKRAVEKPHAEGPHNGQHGRKR